MSSERDTGDRGQRSRPKLFISHRHADERIATVLKEWVERVTRRDVEVFQSSAAGSGPLIGENLNEELRTRLQQSRAIVLIYTTADQDWSYCMWECGVSMNDETRIVVLQCARDVPAPFQDTVRVDLSNSKSLQGFVIDFLTRSNFFPGHGPIAPNLPPECKEIELATEQLRAGLKEVIPDYEWQGTDDWPALPYLRLELPIEAPMPDSDDPSTDWLPVLAECTVRQIDWVAASLFGMADVPPEEKFATLVKIWRRLASGADEAWLGSMGRQMAEADAGQFPTNAWKIMRAARGGIYAPMLQWVRKVPSRRCRQFEFLFIPFDSALTDDGIRISVPQPAP
ncbi:MAG: toll/interleukin-1 receptor domain-containing protein [Rhodocyclaceae bacterium]|nr:toll/interleukin-1 receptor domain-containing protein [Rhodocyclaceae bacterium]